MFSKGKLNWDGDIGIFDKKMIQRFRSENVASGVKSEFFICGPEDFAATAETSLIEDGINKENINLKSLSEKACMSTTSFYRFFKRELGMSPIEYILNEKIKCAKNLLKNPTLQINEVCFLSGFEDSNYFIRLFKKHEGITPKQYQLLYVN